MGETDETDDDERPGPYARFIEVLRPNCDGRLNGLFCCPVCEYPTLAMQNYYEICGLCWWADDGRGYGEPDIPAGGSNGDYCLSEARRNFQEHGDMYRLDTTRINVVAKPTNERVELLRFLRTCAVNGAIDMPAFQDLLKRARCYAP